MKGILIYITTVLLVLGNISCSGFLDKEVDLSLSEKTVFTNLQNTQGALAHLYNYLQDPFQGIGGTCPPGSSTDGQFLGALRDVMTNNAISYWNVHRFHSILTDSYSSADHWFASDHWRSNYRGIRAASQFLKNANVSIIGNDALIGDNNRLYDRYKAEARLLRAIMYFQLTNWFGPVALISDDENGVPIIFDLNNSEALNMSRTPAAEVYQWIANECDAVKDVLPYRYSNEAENWGRVNGAAAYALKSRALLYRASPLTNISANIEWWREAAKAATDMIEKNNSMSSNYSLFRTTNNDVNNNYYQGFVANPPTNDEFILCARMVNTASPENTLSPVGFQGLTNAAPRTNPTQNLVDSYETINGLPIDQDPTYNPQNPYFNRDPRLEQTILHHGSVWGDPVNDEERMIDITYGTGRDFQQLHGGTYTGYYTKKYVNNRPWRASASYNHAAPIFRYGEILLNAAEAINEAYGPNDAYKYVNEVRDRVGMPPYNGMSQAQLRERLQNERRVELCFEDHWWFDERRWKLHEGKTRENEVNLPKYQQFFNIYGVIITPSAAQTFNYGPAQLHQSRQFTTPRNYYFPIPDIEYKKAPNLGQNPGWELMN